MKKLKTLKLETLKLTSFITETDQDLLRGGLRAACSTENQLCRDATDMNVCKTDETVCKKKRRIVLSLSIGMRYSSRADYLYDFNTFQNLAYC